jgi:hypothetical protein
MSFSPATLETELIEYDIKMDLRMVGKEAVRFLHVAHDRAQRRGLNLSATYRNDKIILHSKWYTFFLYAIYEKMFFAIQTFLPSESVRYINLHHAMRR